VSDFTNWRQELAGRKITSGRIVTALDMLPTELVDETLRYLFQHYVRENNYTLNRSGTYWHVISYKLNVRDDEWAGLSFGMLKEMYAPNLPSLADRFNNLTDEWS
jgi:hypothetical protein